ncbi:MAG: hypothetical protein ACFB0G_00470 [Leptolyngbyaceae cyanobacterium]
MSASCETLTLALTVKLLERQLPPIVAAGFVPVGEMNDLPSTKVYDEPEIIYFIL